MLNGVFCRAAPQARARLFGLAAAAWMAWVPAHAAEVAPAEQTVAVPFSQYQGWRETPLQDWRQANERVGEIGGWRSYLREAQQGSEGSDSGHAHHGH